MTKRYTKHVLAMSATAALAACGGGSGSDRTDTDTMPEEQPSDPGYYSGEGDSMAARISNATSIDAATVFTARTVGLDHTFDDNDVNIPELADNEDITFRIFRTSPDAMPTFVVTHGGETTTFGPEHAPDNENYSIEGPGDSDDKFLWTWAGYPIEHAWGFDWISEEEGLGEPLNQKYHIPVGIYYSRGDQGLADLRRYTVIGLETAPGDMPTNSVRAVYEGSVRIDSYPEDGARDRERFDADITLTADFSANTIGGVMDNWENRDLDEDLSAISFMLTPAAITGNGFTTSMAPSVACTECPEVVSSTVAGKFYGPSASETGGTIQARIRNEAGISDNIAVGIFYSSQD